MFSKLVFTAGTQPIEFHLHELVKIAEAVIETTPQQEVQAIPHNVWDFIYDDVLAFGTYFEELSKDTLDPILFVPPHIGKLNHPHQWLSVLPEIKRIDPHSPLVEWWFLIAGRLISVKNKNRCDVYLFLETAREAMNEGFIKSIKDIAIVVLAEKNGVSPVVVIKNGVVVSDTTHLTSSISAFESLRQGRPAMSRVAANERNAPATQAIIDDVSSQHQAINFREYPFYVSDHGFLADIVHGIQEVALDFNWLNGELIYMILQLKEKTLSHPDGSPEDQQMCDALSADIASVSMDELKAAHPDKTEAELRQIQQDYRDDPNYRALAWKKHKDTTTYLINILVKEFIRLRTEQIKNFDIFIYKTLSNLPQYNPDLMIKKVVLTSLAKQISRGDREPLFRPVFAYGTDANGDKYTTFAAHIRQYLQRYPEDSAATLVPYMRRVLANQPVMADDLAFLPNLVAAWFIAEAARNSKSVLTGLMLLDMIENQTQLHRPLTDYGIPLYDWDNVLTYTGPRQQAAAGSGITDGYGTALQPYELGGIHPMAHKGSQGQCRPLKPGVKLTVVQQKEGSLIAHWLYEYLRQFHQATPVALVDVTEAPLDQDLFYHPSDITKPLDLLDKEIIKQQKGISTLTRKGQNTDRLAHKLDELRAERERLAQLQADLASNAQVKHMITERIIKPILRQRLNTLVNGFSPSMTSVAFGTANTTDASSSSSSSGSVGVNSQASVSSSSTMLLSELAKTTFFVPKEVLFDNSSPSTTYADRGRSGLFSSSSHSSRDSSGLYSSSSSSHSSHGSGASRSSRDSASSSSSSSSMYDSSPGSSPGP